MSRKNECARRGREGRSRTSGRQPAAAPSVEHRKLTDHYLASLAQSLVRRGLASVMVLDGNRRLVDE